jgi:hypothetical protein
LDRRSSQDKYRRGALAYMGQGQRHQASAVAGQPVIGCVDVDHFSELDKPWIGCVWELAMLEHEPPPGSPSSTTMCRTSRCEGLLRQVVVGR